MAKRGPLTNRTAPTMPKSGQGGGRELKKRGNGIKKPSEGFEPPTYCDTGKIFPCGGLSPATGVCGLLAGVSLLCTCFGRVHAFVGGSSSWPLTKQSVGGSPNRPLSKQSVGGSPSWPLSKQSVGGSPSWALSKCKAVRTGRLVSSRSAAARAGRLVSSRSAAARAGRLVSARRVEPAA